MKPVIQKYLLPVSLGIVLLVMTTFALLSASGCYKLNPTNTTSTTRNCGTQMGCCPATGCGRNWLGNATQLCYATANACTQAGNNYCRQCY